MNEGLPCNEFTFPSANFEIRVNPYGNNFGSVKNLAINLINFMNTSQNISKWKRELTTKKKWAESKKRKRKKKTNTKTKTKQQQQQVQHYWTHSEIDYLTHF